MDFDFVDALKFSGECVRTFDAKNRIVMPPIYKESFDPKEFFIVCFPNDICLRIYNKEELNAILKKVFVEGGGEKMQALQRFIFSRMIKCELDSQNRFTVPQKLIDLAHINKEVKMVGIGKRVEMWNPELFEKTVENVAAENFVNFSPDF